MHDLTTPKLGLALGGGGARGLAHIGVLRVLEKEGVSPDLITGTSMGGLIGALYASGMSLDEIEANLMGFGQRATSMLRLMDVGIWSGALVQGAKVYDLLATLLGPERTFAELNLPVAVVATDIISGREIVLREGKVVDALRATISVPGVFAPVTYDKYRLVDGGILNNVPVDVARSMGADTVIAVDVLPHYGANEPGAEPAVRPITLPGTLGMMQQAYDIQMIMVSALTDLRLKAFPPDVMIWPDLPTDVTLFFGFKRATDIIAAGQQAAEAALPQIRARLGRTS
ncbi:MAG: patatin-like phospholipase family protein [Anaerolineae bacterium]